MCHLPLSILYYHYLSDGIFLTAQADEARHISSLSLFNSIVIKTLCHRIDSDVSEK